MIISFFLLVFPLLIMGKISKEDCRNPRNEIIAENCKPGNSSRDWDVNADGDPTIQGFSNPFSINKGEDIEFKVKTDSSKYRIDIYRVGWYDGLGARHIESIKPSATLPQTQPDCYRDEETLLFDCGNWEVSAVWTSTPSTVSGVYLARLVREDGEESWRSDNSPYGADIRFSYPDETPGEMTARPAPDDHAYGAQGHGKLQNSIKEPKASLIYFVVREDGSSSEVVFQTSDTTWQAYNLYGGANTYYGLYPPFRRAYKVSYNRPFQTRATRAVNILFGVEYPMIRWLECNGYDVSYQAGSDTDRNPVSRLLHHKLFLSVGHDEYWSGQQRRVIEEARDSGLNLAFFSGNEVFWRIRWEENYRHLVVYKESQEKAKKDPKLDEWTGTWRDSRPFNPLGPNPENSLTGTIFTVNAWRHDALEIPYEFSKLRFWRNTSVNKLNPGEKKVLKPGLLGHEWDEDIDNGFRPAGLVRLSRTTVNNVWMVQDFIANCDSGTASHSLVIYRAKSGALVFGAGTVQWSWGLDDHRDTETGVPPERANPTNIRVGVDQMGTEPDIIQATMNLFVDMGVYPGVEAVDAGLVLPLPSADTQPPHLELNEISYTQDGGVMVRGVAKDVHGITAAIEFSADDGNTWHPVDFTTSGRSTSWAFKLKTFKSTDVNQIEAYSGSVVKKNEQRERTILVRGVDDSYNIGQPVHVVVNTEKLL